VRPPARPEERARRANHGGASIVLAALANAVGGHDAVEAILRTRLALEPHLREVDLEHFNLLAVRLVEELLLGEGTRAQRRVAPLGLVQPADGRDVPALALL